MGDRGEVKIEPMGIYLYTHWGAADLPNIVKTALLKGQERWNDPPYLARVIFQEMVGDDESITGYGIQIDHQEDVWRLITVNTDKQTVTIQDNDKKPKTKIFRKYVSLE